MIIVGVCSGVCAYYVRINVLLTVGKCPLSPGLLIHMAHLIPTCRNYSFCKRQKKFNGKTQPLMH